MKKHGILVLGALVVAALVGMMVTNQTDYNEWTIITTFGKPGRPIDGSKEAGLQWRLPWPIQQVVEYDARLRLLVSELTQINTQGGGSITVTANCTWRIAEPLLFLSEAETPERGEKLLRAILGENVAAVITRHTLGDLVSTGGDPERQAKLEEAILGGVKKAAARRGMDVTTVGIEALGVPAAVSEKIIESQKEERKALANSIRSKAKAEKQTIIDRAKEDGNVVQTFAQGRAEQIRTRGFARIVELYKEFNEFPELAIFLRKLKMMETSFSLNSVIYVDANLIDVVKLLYEKLAAPGKASVAPAAPAAPAKTPAPANP